MRTLPEIRRAQAIEFQAHAAAAHLEAVDCMSPKRHQPMRRSATSFQRVAAFYAHRARKCLFELLGVELDDIASLAALALYAASLAACLMATGAIAAWEFVS